MTNPEIATCLFIAAGTVRKHLDNIYAKLGVRGRAHAVAVTAGDRVHAGDRLHPSTAHSAAGGINGAAVRSGP